MPPNLQPISQLSAKILPSTGSYTEVLSSLAFGIYSSNAFISGCVDAVSYVYQKLGGNILDIELETSNVYNAYEDAVLTYSKIINTHQAKNILLSALGASTGSFNQDGELTSGQSISLKYPNFTLGYARTMAEGFANEAGFGGTSPIYSASFQIIPGVQDYNLQAIMSSSTEFSGIVGDNRIIVRDVFYRTPQSMWRFFGYYGQFNVIGAWGAYGQYANDSTFFLAPVFQTKLQASAFEDALWTRTSHYSYEILNNNIRIFPIPTIGSPKKMWFRFSVKTDPWSSGSNNSNEINGVNNINTLPFANIPYENINSMGKHFIREYCLANCMETLSFVRGKYGQIPLPKNQVNLNAADLRSRSDKMKEELIKMLMDDLEQLKYSELTKQRKEMADNAQDLLLKIPLPIYLK
jgi:hypothetical protein